MFVYGREVNDFRTVDYDAIAMLNVSATQELHRLVQSQAAEIAALKQQTARIAELEQKMAQILAAAQGAPSVTKASFALAPGR